MLSFLVLHILLFIQPITSIPGNRPHCRIPAPRQLPKITDCLHVVRDIRIQNREVHNRLFTISRRRQSNFHVPTTWWDHVPHSTCAIHLDMINDRPDASDELRLEDVLKTAEEVIEECLVPRSTERWGGSDGVSRSLSSHHGLQYDYMQKKRHGGIYWLCLALTL